MRIFKKAYLPVLFVLFLALNGVLNFLLIPYQFTRLKVRAVETGANRDLILGSSHGCAGIDPAVLAKETQRSCFNAAAGGQYPRENVYLLRDACLKEAPERVIFEYDPAYWVSGDPYNRTARYQFDVMAPSQVKAAYFMDLLFKNDFRYLFMPWAAYMENVPIIGQIVKTKTGEAYRTYGAQPFDGRYQTCRPDGFTAIHVQDRDALTPPSLAFTQENEGYVEKNRAYFEKLAALCLERGITLTVVTTPVPAVTLDTNRTFYEQAHRIMETLSRTYGFTYLDYAAGPEALTLPDTDFADGEGHMYETAAAQFSKHLAEDLESAGHSYETED